MHKSSKKTLPVLTRDVFAARLAGAKTRNDLFRDGFTDEQISATEKGVEALTEALANGVFEAHLGGARFEAEFLACGFSKEEIALVSDRVARRVREAEPMAA